MSPLTLIVVIALGVAIGIAAAPHIGTFFAATGVVLLVIATLFVASMLLRISVREGVLIGAKIKQLLFCKFRELALGVANLYRIRASWSDRFLQSSTPHLVQQGWR